MSSSLIYPFALLMGSFSHLDSLIVWSMLIVSVGLNLYLFKRNKTLKFQLKNQQASNHDSNLFNRTVNYQQSNHSYSNSSGPEQTIALSEVQSSSLSALEEELNDTIWLNDNDNCNEDDKNAIEIAHETVSVPRKNNNHRIQNALQSLSGWHKSLVPFLVQNIGWFIGVLCFISGTVFFISYTEGFTKSVTIFFTILSYTLLLAWGGYRLKDRVAHAAISGNVLMAISFLLVPLNFSAAAQLLGNSIGGSQYGIAAMATIIALVTLFFICKIVSGVFNRQFLSYFSSLFYSLSSIQLLVPVLHNSQSTVLLLVLQIGIIIMLLMALVYYLPAVLKLIFVDRKYLLLFSIGSLIYAALVSTIHISLASPITISLSDYLSYYAPVLMLIAVALFYMDALFSEYKSQISLLSRFSFVAYAVSFAAIFSSLDSEVSRTLTLLMASLLYARLMWVYRSLVPLYLVIIVLSFLHYDVILVQLLIAKTGLNMTTAYQWYYLSSLPLLGLFSGILFLFRKSEQQRSGYFQITRHLFHFIMLSSILLGVFSQWFITPGIITVINSAVVILASFYLLKSSSVKASDLLSEKISSAYYYLLLFLPVILILVTRHELIAIDVKLIVMTLIAWSYSLNSQFHFMTLFTRDEKTIKIDQEILINASLLISLLLLVLAGLGFSLSIKIAVLIFVIALNSLFLSMKLYNRALFYVFVLIASVAVLILKLTLSSSPSTGLLTISFALVLFYFIHWLDRKRRDEVEALRSEAKHQHNPEKILWVYPANDFSVKLSDDTMEAIKNV